MCSNGCLLKSETLPPGTGGCPAVASHQPVHAEGVQGHAALLPAVPSERPSNPSPHPLIRNLGAPRNQKYLLPRLGILRLKEESVPSGMNGGPSPRPPPPSVVLPNKRVVQTGAKSVPSTHPKVPLPPCPMTPLCLTTKAPVQRTPFWSKPCVQHPGSEDRCWSLDMEGVVRSSSNGNEMIADFWITPSLVWPAEPSLRRGDVVPERMPALPLPCGLPLPPVGGRCTSGATRRPKWKARPLW